MSIVRQLIAVSAVQAMRGATIAGDNVCDSAVTAIDGMMEKRDKPVLLVSVEQVDQEKKDEPGLFARSSVAKIFVQAAVWSQVSIEDGENAGEFIAIGETDAAREATLNILDRQWRSALSDPRNPWADLFRRMVPFIVSVRDQRMVDPESKARLAARFTEITVHAIEEPAFGAGIPEDIEAGLAMLEATSCYAHLGPIWRRLLATEDVDWRATQARIFASDVVMGALGLMAGDPPVTGTTATIAIDGRDEITVTDGE